MIRFASRVAANLSEGYERIGRDRLHHYRIACASAMEVDVDLRLLTDSLACRDRSHPQPTITGGFAR